MTLLGFVPALIVLVVGAALYVRICLRFPPALVLGVVAYSMISKCASVAYLETSEVYIIEVGMVSYFVGATTRQILYNLLVFLIALSVIRWTIASRRPALIMRAARFGSADYNRELRLVLFISAALLGLQVLNALFSPPYALPGSLVTRNQFWANIRVPVIADLVGILVIFVPSIAGVALAYGKVTNQPYFGRFSIRLMLAYGFFFILSGARFNGLLMALLFWLGSYWIVLWAFGKKLYVKRMGLLVTLAIGFFFVIGYLEIADRGITQITGSAWNGLLYRAFVLQGDIYFAADVMAGDGRSHSVSVLLEGMPSTVRAYMPPALAEAYLNKGVNLAGSLPGNAIAVYGYWFGLIPMAIYGLLLGIVTSVYVYIIVSGRFILVLPGAYLSLWSYGGYTHGSFSPFLDYKFTLFISMMIAWQLLSRPELERRQIRVRMDGTKGERL